MDIHVVHAGGVECVTVAVDASVAVLRAAVAECLCLVPECTVLAHEDGAPFGGADCALDVALCDVLCSDTVHVRPPSAAEVARSLGGRRENLAAALCKELREGRGDGGRAQALLLVLDPSHWNRVFPSTLMGAIGNCPTPAVLERLLASCGDCILSGGYQSLCMGCPTVNRTSGLRPWELRLCLRAGMPLRAGLLEAYGRSWRWSVPRDEVEIMLEEVPERCFEVGLLHGIFACGDDALLERCLALGALPEGALRKAVEAGPVAVSCAPRLVAAGCVVDADLVLAASQLGQVEWLQWLFDEAGCGVDVADAGGRTALHVAGSVAVVRFLAARGARPDLRRMGGLSVVHREPEASDAGSARTHSNNYRSYAQHDAAFAEVLATWPWLVHAEDLEGRTALRWMWERLCRLRKCWESTCTVQTIARSKHLVAFGANVQAMVGLQTIDCVKIAVHVIRDERGRAGLRFEDLSCEKSDDESCDAPVEQNEAYEKLCCRVKRSGCSSRRREEIRSKHTYRAWVPHPQSTQHIRTPRRLFSQDAHTTAQLGFKILSRPTPHY